MSKDADDFMRDVCQGTVTPAMTRRKAMTDPTPSGQTPETDAIIAGRVREYANETLCKLEVLARSLERRLQDAEKERDAYKKESTLRLHMILTCGVAAEHPDANLSRTGAYIKKWNSKQAEAVRALRERADVAEAQLERAEKDGLEYRKMLGGFAVDAMQQEFRELLNWASTAKVEFPDGAPILAARQGR